MRRRARIAASLVTILLAGCGEDAGTAPPPTMTPAVVEGPIGDRLGVDERIDIDGLKGPVDVVRDEFGRPHLYATDALDAMRVEGYFQAKDRTLQLDVLRRVAEGRLAELYGDLDPSVIDMDIAYRHIGLGRVAKAEYDAFAKDDVLRATLDAFADGVTQAFAELRSGALPMPEAIAKVEPSTFEDWKGEDSLAIARLQSYLLSFDADLDLENQAFFDAARATFTPSDPDPLVAKRAGIERDLFRFAPGDPTTTTSGYPITSGAPSPSPSPPPHSALVDRASTSGWRAAMKATRQMFRKAGFGSNDWAIAPSRSANGHAMVASDPHLTLTAPAIFWPVSIDVTAPEGGDASQDLHVGGVAFPGIPGIILGHNDHVAWGATVAGYDVSDAYAETLTADGNAVLFRGAPVALETIDEEIKIKGKSSYHYKVEVVPHHGPILPDIEQHRVAPLDPSKGAISIRWTGLEPTTELAAVNALLRAKSVDEAIAALGEFQVGAQNWMLGDVDGDIGWTSHAVVPTRDRRAFQWDSASYEGTLPCLVLPGDGTAEWTGTLDDALVPFEENPIGGYLSTANNDPIGVTLDNDPSNDELPDGTPMYLACTFDIGFREGRIHRRIEGHAAPLASTDLQDIQGDHHSPMGAAIGPRLLAAIDDAEAERKKKGQHPDLDAIIADVRYDAATMQAIETLLSTWATNDYVAESGVDPDTNVALDAKKNAVAVASSQATFVFDAWLVAVVDRSFGDELAKMNATLDHQMKARALLRLFDADPHSLATFDPATGDSAIWDDLTTPAVESREAQMILALLDALDAIHQRAGADLDAIRWGTAHTVRFDALVPLYPSLSIPPSDDATYPNGFPRPGDLFNVDAAEFSIDASAGFSYSEGPAQRFVAEMDPNGVKAVNAIPGGNVWDPKSPHFSDEADDWKKNATHPIPFSIDEVVAAAEKRSVVETKK